MSPQSKRDLGITIENDGEFYMNFNRDFIKYFGEIEAVHITPTNMESLDQDQVKNFEVFHLFGEWAGETAKGAVAQIDGKTGFEQNANILKEIFNEIKDDNSSTVVPGDSLGNLKNRK